MDLLFSQAEIKFIQFNHGVLRTLLSITQNRVFNLRKFSAFLIPTNQNRHSIVMEILINFMSTTQK